MGLAGNRSSPPCAASAACKEGDGQSMKSQRSKRLVPLVRPGFCSAHLLNQAEKVLFPPRRPVALSS